MECQVSRKMSGGILEGKSDTLNLIEPEIAFSFEREGKDPTSDMNPKELNILAYYYPTEHMPEKAWFALLIGQPWSITEESLRKLEEPLRKLTKPPVPLEVLQKKLRLIMGKTAAGERKFAFLCREAIGEEDWKEWGEEILETILECAHKGTKPVIPQERWTRNPLTEEQWFALLDLCDMYKARLYLYNKKIPWSALSRTSIAPPYLREQLLNEAQGQTWETTHAFKESTLSTIVSQMLDLEKVLGGSASDRRSSYHIHLSFRRPKITNDGLRSQWAWNLARLAYHLNNYAILRMYEFSDIHNPLLAPYYHRDLEPLAERLAKSEIKRDEDGLEETSGTTNVGIYKQAATALRQCYKSEKSRPDFDLEIFGFEFRDWQSLKERIPHIEHVERFLRLSELCQNGDTPIDLGAGGKYMLASLEDFRYLSPETAAWLLSHHPKAVEVIKQAAINELGVEEEDEKEEEVEELALKLMLPFLDWASHPAVPDVVGKQLSSQERQKVAAELEALYDAMMKEEKGQPLTDEEREIVKEHDDGGLFRFVERRVHLWAQSNQVWKYF